MYLQIFNNQLIFIYIYMYTFVFGMIIKIVKIGITEALKHMHINQPLGKLELIL